jgi:hypothetical protein
MPGKRPLPRDTAEVINSQVLNNCCNLGLLLNRFQPWIQDQARQQWNLSLEIKEIVLGYMTIHFCYQSINMLIKNSSRSTFNDGYN